MPETIKILIVDDSSVIRKVLGAALAEEPDIEVVGAAPDPYVARDRILELKPDVVLLDIDMPRMDGLTFLRKLMKYHPIPVIMVSSLTPERSALALEALEAGAVEVLLKPGASYRVGELRGVLAEKIRAAARAGPKGVGRLLRRAERTERTERLSMKGTSEKLVAIGASTGGTEAIRTILAALPADGPAVLVVQHMPGQFIGAFAARLDQSCELDVRVAGDGDEPRPGLVLLAPGDVHMVLRGRDRRYEVKLRKGPRVNYQRPSVDVLFKSMADYAGEHAVGVLLTGMGNDGAAGLLAMKQAGAHTLAQDETTSVVFGMPGTAVELGAVECVCPLDRIAAEILEACVRESKGRTST